MSRPTIDALLFAAEWLDCYEDDKRCAGVAEWLREQVEAAEFRKACKDAGVSVGKARAALKKAVQS